MHGPHGRPLDDFRRDVFYHGLRGQIDHALHTPVLPELQPKARIEGDVAYKALEMHQGAVIAGQLRPMAGADEKPLLKLAANNP